MGDRRRELLTIDDLLEVLELQHLELRAVTLDGLSSILESQGRVGLLQFLKAEGVARLTERQAVANGLAKARRVGRELGTGGLLFATEADRAMNPMHRESPLLPQMQPQLLPPLPSTSASPSTIASSLYDVRLADAERLSERVCCVRGLNPGPFTGPGTNTYIVGIGPEVTLIDAGDSGHQQYLRLLERTLDDLCGGARISRILITHSHPDHIGGARDVARRCGSANGCAVCKVPWPNHDAGLTIVAVTDGDVLRVDERTTLRALHTPGHAPDHCCFELIEEKFLFSGDTILGAGTVVIPAHGGDMSASHTAPCGPSCAPPSFLSVVRGLFISTARPQS